MPACRRRSSPWRRPRRIARCVHIAPRSKRSCTPPAIDEILARSCSGFVRGGWVGEGVERRKKEEGRRSAAWREARRSSSFSLLTRQVLRRFAATFFEKGNGYADEGKLPSP